MFQRNNQSFSVPIVAMAILVVSLLTTTCDASPSTPKEGSGSEVTSNQSQITLSTDDNLVLAPIKAIDPADISSDMFLFLPVAALPKEKIPSNISASDTSSTAAIVPLNTFETPPDYAMVLIPKDKVKGDVDGATVYTGDLELSNAITLTPGDMLFLTIEDSSMDTALSNKSTDNPSAEVSNDILNIEPSNVVIVSDDLSTFNQDLTKITVTVPDADGFADYLNKCPNCAGDDPCRFCTFFCLICEENPDDTTK